VTFLVILFLFDCLGQIYFIWLIYINAVSSKAAEVYKYWKKTEKINTKMKIIIVLLIILFLFLLTTL